MTALALVVAVVCRDALILSNCVRVWLG